MTDMHPQTRAAWERAMAPRPAKPYDHKARAAARYERTWDAIEAAYARREGTALWWEEGRAEVAKQAAARAERARQEAALRAYRNRAATHEGEATPERRARGWLAKRAETDSSKAASWAVMVVVRGFGLGKVDGRALIEREYEPRFYRKFAARELDGWVRHAMNARLPWGWKLTEERRTG